MDTPTGERLVLRRYHAWTTQEALASEHTVVRHLANAGWVGPSPLGEPIELDGRRYSLTRYVPGAAGARKPRAAPPDGRL